MLLISAAMCGLTRGFVPRVELGISAPRLNEGINYDWCMQTNIRVLFFLHCVACVSTDVRISNVRTKSYRIPLSHDNGARLYVSHTCSNAIEDRQNSIINTALYPKLRHIRVVHVRRLVDDD